MLSMPIEIECQMALTIFSTCSFIVSNNYDQQFYKSCHLLNTQNHYKATNVFLVFPFRYINNENHRNKYCRNLKRKNVNKETQMPVFSSRRPNP